MSYSNKVYIIGVGMTKFLKPGSHKQSYIDLASEATKKALKDAEIKYSEIDHGYVGYVFQSSCAGQRALYEVGMTGIPIINVNNNCATGSTAFNLAYEAVKSGISKCSIALGFDQMQKGALPLEVADPIAPTHKYALPLIKENKFDIKGPSAPQIFAGAGREHIEKYGSNQDHLSKISVKNYKHGSNNPYAQFRKEVSLSNVNSSASICSPLNKLHCCPTSDGAACAVLCNEEYLNSHPNIKDQAVEVLACVLETDKEDTFNTNSMIDIVGFKTAERAVKKALSSAKISIEDVGAIELHDCFSANELITYESLGLCEKGKAGEFIDKGNNTYGGKYVVNPSGGLTSKGHPLGATGLAQITELTWQLRGMADQRQVKDLKYALSHNLGLGSAVVITVLKKFNGKKHTSKTTSSPEALSLEGLKVKF